MTSTLTPEQIADKLTEAQRHALEGIYHRPIEFILFSRDEGAIVSLRDQGLVGGVGDATCLTPLGLSVRKVLQDREQGGGE